jgi:hypothetical protein
MTLQGSLRRRKVNAWFSARRVLIQESTWLMDGKKLQSKNSTSVVYGNTQMLTSYGFFLRYLHTRFVALDANFRLKRKNVSSDQADPGLSRGWAYFVDEEKYKDHLNRYKHETEPVSFFTFIANNLHIHFFEEK